MEFTKLSDFGNFIFSGIGATKLDDKDKEILENVRPVGILFLKRNFLQGVEYEKWQEELATLISDIKKYSGREKLFFTVDHEGGQVQRTPDPITNFGRPANYKSNAGKVAEAMAIELKSIGINLSWSPSADINTNPQNPIIGKLGRSFSNSPEEVAKACVEFHKSMTKNGVLTCAKHFPGHGDTWSDSHKELPIVDLDEETLIKRELLPFKALIDSGIESIMSSHVLFRNIDPKDPATFSKKILTDILRTRLGFKGVIFADDINMLAIFNRIRTLEGVSQSINAGIDSYIVGRFPTPEKDESPLVITRLLKEATEKGMITKEKLLESSSRVENLLNKAGNYSNHILENNIFAQHQTLIAPHIA